MQLPPVKKLFAALLAVVGAGLLVWTFFLCQSAVSSVYPARRNARIVANIAKGGKFAPIFSFEEKGMVLRVQSRFLRTSEFPLDSMVDITFNPTNPMEAEIYDFGTLWGLPLGVGILGALLLGIGVVVYAPRRPRADSKTPASRKKTRR